MFNNINLKNALAHRALGSKMLEGFQQPREAVGFVEFYARLESAMMVLAYLG